MMLICQLNIKNVFAKNLEQNICFAVKRLRKIRKSSAKALKN
jgi:hypothetical protein